ncbi:MAG: hypothetical protein MK180_12805 [Rhodobacteraceae bacterium]|nr:hypothetical protein [Paracoccaceae bacterium]
MENANRRNIERMNAAFPELDLPARPQPDGNEIGAAPWDINADVAAILDRHDATLVAHLEALVPALNDEGVPLTLTSSHADTIAYMANTYDIEPNVVADLAAAYYARSGLKELAVDVKKLRRKGGT